MVIIDTSVVYKWFAEQEKDHRLSKKLLERYLLGEQEITIPDLLLYELTNAWSTKTGLDSSQINKNLTKFASYAVPIVTVNFSLLEHASHFSKTYTVSVYDAVFVVLAQNYECELVTADEKFVKQINLPFVKLLRNYTK